MCKDIHKIKSDQGSTLKVNFIMMESQSGAPLYYDDASLGQTAIAVNSTDVFNLGAFSHNQAVKLTSKNFDSVANYR